MNRRVWTGVLFLIAVGAIALFLWEANLLSQSQANLQAAWSTATQQVVLNNRQATAGAQEVAQAATQAADVQSQAVADVQNQAATAQAEIARQAAIAQAQAVEDAQNAAATREADLQAQVAATLTDAQNQAATVQAAALVEAATEASRSQESALLELQNRASLAQFQAVFDAQNQAATAVARLLVTQGALEVQLATAQAAASQTSGQTNLQPTAFSPTLAPTTAATVAPTQVANVTPTTQEGWQQFQTPGFAFLLPTTYVGGDLTQDAANVASRLQALGADFSSAASYAQRNSAGFAFMAFDTATGPARGVTHVRIATGDLGSTLDMQTFLDQFVAQSGSTVSVVEQSVVPLGVYQAGRVVAEFTSSSGSKYRELDYLLLQGTTAWIVTYATLASEFSANLPAFEQSAQSIRLSP